MTKLTVILCAAALSISLLTGCADQTAPSFSSEASEAGSSADPAPAAADQESSDSEAADSETAATEAVACPLADGLYEAEFITDSGMFHVNDACGGKGTLTVENGRMTIHVSLVSKSILNLYLGTADEAMKDEDGWLMPTTDTVTYEDGLSDEVYGFDIPVEALSVDFDCALIGKKGIWYDHKVSVANAVPLSP